MATVEYARTMARYNRWMNERIYAGCASIPDGERKRDRGAFFRSIHGTLNHLLLGDRVWLGRFTGAPVAFASLDQELYADFDALRRERTVTDDAIDAWVATLTETKLAAPFAFTAISRPGEHRYPLWHVVVHFFNHETHHRGQVTTLMKQCGVDPGVTDLLWLPGVGLG
jgi:uncharacterized damage-inducible protein DinB